MADGIYAVNVFWKGKGLTSFQPYASGLFDNPYRVEIGLIEGYVYRFDCSFLGYKDRPYYTIQSDSILYGLPFSSTLQKEVNGVSQQRFKDFNQSPEYQWGISPTYLQRRNAYKMR